MAAPYQIENCKFLNELTGNEYHFVFCSKLENNRPKYWSNTPFEKINIHILNTPIVDFKNLYLNLDVFSKLKELKPDVIIVGGYNIPTGILSAIWGRYNNIETVLYLERLLPSGFIKSRAKKIFLYFVSKLFDKIIAVGNDAYKEYFHLNKKIRNIPYLINLSRYGSTFVKPANKMVDFLYSGRFDENQNVINVAKAFKILSQERSDVRMTFSGNGPLEVDLNRICSDELSSKRIRFDNEYASWFDLPELYRKADVLVAPLNHSGWGFVIQEAMASGLPVISTLQTTASSEYIINNYNGKICETDVDSILSSMRYYVEYPLKIEEHSRVNENIFSIQNYEYFITEFDQFVSGVK